MHSLAELSTTAVNEHMHTELSLRTCFPQVDAFDDVVRQRPRGGFLQQAHHGVEEQQEQQSGGRSGGAARWLPAPTSSPASTPNQALHSPALQPTWTSSSRCLLRITTFSCNNARQTDACRVRVVWCYAAACAACACAKGRRAWAGHGKRRHACASAAPGARRCQRRALVRAPPWPLLAPHGLGMHFINWLI